MIPRATSGCPSFAVSAARRRVQAMASSSPPPRAYPLMAAMLGLPRRSRRLSTSWPRRAKAAPSTGFWDASSPMSAPATNAFSPMPVTISTPVDASSPAAATARSISCMVRRSRAFSFSGRLMVSRAIPFWLSYSTRFEPLIASPFPRGPARAGLGLSLRQKVVGPGGLARVVVEPLAGLASVKPREHHPFHQGRRSEPPLAELVEHDVGNVIRGVDSDQIQEGERAHRVSAAELHALVDVGDAADALLDGAEGVQDVRHQQAVHNEAGAVQRSDRHLPQALREAEHRLLDPRVGLDGADELDQLHEGDRVEEVQADETLRPFRGHRHFGYRQRRGVAGEDRLFLEGALESAESLLLGPQVLHHGFDHEIAILEVLVFGCSGEPRQGRLLLFRADLSLRHARREKLVDPPEAGVQDFPGDLQHRGGIAGLRRDLSD